MAQVVECLLNNSWVHTWVLQKKRKNWESSSQKHFKEKITCNVFKWSNYTKMLVCDQHKKTETYLLLLGTTVLKNRGIQQIGNKQRTAGSEYKTILYEYYL
jgi:hypothetical protein